MFKKCETCKREMLWFLIRKRKVVVPTAGIALSKKKMCSRCHKTILRLLKHGR